MSLNVAGMTGSEIRDLMEQIAELQKTRQSRKNELRDELLETLLTSDVEPWAMPKGTGWFLSGSKVKGADGKLYRVNVFVRDESTIPEKDKETPAE